MAPMSDSKVRPTMMGRLRPPLASSPRLMATNWPSPMARPEARQGVALDHAGAQGGEIALGQLRVALVEVLGGHKAQDGVAQELQALIGGQDEVGVLVEVGPVREGLLQRGSVPEGEAQLLFQRTEVR